MKEKIKKLFICEFTLIGVLLILSIFTCIFCGIFDIDLTSIRVKCAISMMHLIFLFSGQIFTILYLCLH